MNRNLRFGIEIAVFVLIAALLITDICFHLPGRSSDTPQIGEGTDTGTGTEETVNYLPDGTEKTPEEKFGRYTHIDKCDVTLFSEEETAAWRERRLSGERYALSEEEIEYLIADTTELYLHKNPGYRLYFAAQESRMFYLFSTDGIEGFGLSPLTDWENSPFYIVRRTERGTYYRYEDLRYYARFCRDIYDIILYRMEMLSCREAFITERDIARFAGTKNATDKPIWYIPYLSDDTNRDEILAACAGLPGSDPALKNTLIALSAQPNADRFHPYRIFRTEESGTEKQFFPIAEIEKQYDIADTEYYLSKGPSYSINLLVLHPHTYTAELYRITDGVAEPRYKGTFQWEEKVIRIPVAEWNEPQGASEDPYVYAFIPYSDVCVFFLPRSNPSDSYTMPNGQMLFRITPEDPGFPKGVIEP